MNSYSSRLLQNLEQLSLEQLSHERKKIHSVHKHSMKEMQDQSKGKNKKEKLNGSIFNVLKLLLHTRCGKQTTVK
jgi:hypothetical protein